jgi:hypothetical protein
MLEFGCEMPSIEDFVLNAEVFRGGTLISDWIIMALTSPLMNSYLKGPLGGGA